MGGVRERTCEASIPDTVTAGTAPSGGGELSSVSSSMGTHHQQANAFSDGLRRDTLAHSALLAETRSWPMVPRFPTCDAQPMASSPRAPLSAPARAVYKALLKAATPPSRAAETHVTTASLTPQPPARGAQQRAGTVGRQARDPGVLPWTRASSDGALDTTGGAGGVPPGHTPPRRAASRFEEDWARRQPSEWDALSHEVRRRQTRPPLLTCVAALPLSERRGSPPCCARLLT